MLCTWPLAIHSAIGFAGRDEIRGTSVGAGNDRSDPSRHPIRRRTAVRRAAAAGPDPPSAAFATCGSIAAPTTDAIAVRRPRSAIAEESTISRWRSVRSTRRGSPREVASAPATSGTGMGGSTGSASDGCELDTARWYPAGRLRQAVDRRSADDGPAIVLGHPIGDLAGVRSAATRPVDDFAMPLLLEGVVRVRPRRSRRSSLRARRR